MRIVRDLSSAPALTIHSPLVMIQIYNRLAMNNVTAATNTLFKTLSDPTRRSLFERLCREGEQTVWRLTQHARISQPAVSKHLAALKATGLVRDRREGRETHYRAAPEALAPLIDWMSFYSTFWRDRFDRLENLLQRMDQ